MTGELSGSVSKIQRYSIDDGPGIRTTVFLKGCPLKCPWCHNPETQDYYPEIFFRKAKCIGCGKCEAVCPIPNAITFKTEHRINRQLCIRCMKCTQVCSPVALEQVGQILKVSEVIDEVKRDMPFYSSSGGGLTVSGGEPLAQADFTAELLKEAKALGINTCIETNGYVANWIWEKVLPYLDLVLFDIKQTDSVMHRKVIGVGNEVILNNARELASEVDVIIRIPLIPGFNDTIRFADELGQFANSTGIRVCHIIPYHDYGATKYLMLGRKYNGISNSVRETLPLFIKRMETYKLEVTVL